MCYVSNEERKDCEVSLYGIELADGKVIKSLEADKFLEEKMKLNVSKEYIRRFRKVLKPKLNGRNLVCGVNT